MSTGMSYYIKLTVALIALAIVGIGAHAAPLEKRSDRMVEHFKKKEYGSAIVEADAIIAEIGAPNPGGWPEQSWQDAHMVKAWALKATNKCGDALALVARVFLPAYQVEEYTLAAQCNEALGNWLAASTRWESLEYVLTLHGIKQPSTITHEVKLANAYAQARWNGNSNDREAVLAKAEEALAQLQQLGASNVFTKRIKPKIELLFGWPHKARYQLEQLLTEANRSEKLVLFRDIARIDAQLGNWESVYALAMEAVDQAIPDHPVLQELETYKALAENSLGQSDAKTSMTKVTQFLNYIRELEGSQYEQILQMLEIIQHMFPLADNAEDKLALVGFVETIDRSIFEKDFRGQLLVFRLSKQAALSLLDLGDGKDVNEAFLRRADKLIDPDVYSSPDFIGVNLYAPPELKILAIEAELTLRDLQRKAVKGTQTIGEKYVYSDNDLLRTMGRIADEDLLRTPTQLAVAERQKRAKYRNIYERAISATYGEHSAKIMWRDDSYIHFSDDGKVDGRFGVSEQAREQIESAFGFSQSARITAAGRAMASTMARLTEGNSILSQLLRQYDALLEQRVLYETSNDKQARDTRDNIDRQLTRVSQELTAINPLYDAMLRPGTLSATEVRSALEEDEALLKYVATEHGLFSFLVTRADFGFYRVSLSTGKLTELVESLRKGLDPSSYARGAFVLDESETTRYAGAKFDIESAHELYQALIAPHESLLTQTKTLHVVPDGPLLSIPFSMLVRRTPDFDISSYADYAQVDWAIRRFAFSTLPILSALGSRRKKIRDSSPPTFVGIGDPVFTGTSSPIRITRGGIGQSIDVAALRSLSPLPETSDELRLLNKFIAKGKGQLLLREAANEQEVRAGALVGVRVIAFATHGLISGDINGINEPALVLTPPITPSVHNDGLLTSSEITQIKLNADWIILSACNTAAGIESANTEGLSGLARAFLYAGARGLLASHWPIRSDAAVSLTTGMFESMNNQAVAFGPKALQTAIINMIDFPEVENWRHPSAWAPFIVIGV